MSDPDLDPIHYVTCYLMAEPIEETLDDFFALGARAAPARSFPPHRQAHLTGPFRVGETVAAPRVLVSPAAVPYRAHRGIYVIVEDDRRCRRGRTPPRLLDVPGVAGVWSFASVAGHDVEAMDGGRAPDHGVLARRRAARRRRSRLAPLVAGRPATFAGPFETITPWKWDWFDPA